MPTEPDLTAYRVTGDDLTGANPIVVLSCDTCSQGYRGRGDVRWWEGGDAPSIADLIAEARSHETTGHRH